MDYRNVKSLVVCVIFCMLGDFARSIDPGDSCDLNIDASNGTRFVFEITGNAEVCKADIAITIDSSGSLRNDFCKEIEVAQRIANQFKIGSDDVLFGGVSFSSSATIEFDLDAAQTNPSVLMSINMIKYAGALTNINDALTKVRQVLSGPNARPGVPKISIFMTDGNPTTGGTDIDANVAALGSIKQIAVGFGSVSKDVLMTLAQDDEDRVFFEPDIDKILNSTIIPNIAAIACSLAACDDWSDWSACDQTCGRGVQSRVRTCCVKGNTDDGVCQRPQLEVRTCQNQSCPVDGNWGEWCCTFGECSKSCGGGTKSRKRLCNNPAPAYGGQPCNGSDMETMPCNTMPCPSWSTWSSWSNCSKKCDYGIQTRMRKCLNVPDDKCGCTLCSGRAKQKRSCIKKCCCPYKQPLRSHYCNSRPNSFKLDCPSGSAIFIDGVCTARRVNRFKVTCGGSVPGLQTRLVKNCNGKSWCMVNDMCSGRSSSTILAIAYSCCGSGADGYCMDTIKRPYGGPFGLPTVPSGIVPPGRRRW